MNETVAILLRYGSEDIDLLCKLLRRYRNEVPLGHQPHMIAQEVDDAIAVASHIAVCMRTFRDANEQSIVKSSLPHSKTVMFEPGAPRRWMS